MSPVPQGTAEFIAHIFSAQARLRTRAEYFAAVASTRGIRPDHIQRQKCRRLHRH
jgi:hypothetical protein